MGFSHIRQFMAGAKMTLPAAAHTVVVSRSSQMPPATLPIILAVAATTTITSPNSASAMCSISIAGISPNVSHATSLPDRARSVASPTNSVAFRVTTTRTSASAWRRRLMTSHAL